MPADAETDAPARIQAAPSHAPDLGLIARMGAKVRKSADALRAANARVAELEAFRAAAEPELARYKAERDPSAVAQRAERAEAELRTLKHRRTFDRLAAESGVRPEALDDLYQLSGYAPEGDAVDEAAVRAAIDGQRAARSYLFGAADANPGASASTATAGQAADRLPPGPGLHRGGASDRAPQKFTEAQLSDPAFVMRNYKAISAAAKDAVERSAV